MGIFRRKTSWDKRDQAIGKASDLLHEAIGQLRLAHYYAAEMKDKEFATALWELADEMPVVTREIDGHLHPTWRVHLDHPRLPLRALSGGQARAVTRRTGTVGNR
jgi:hypothetical protein